MSSQSPSESLTHPRFKELVRNKLQRRERDLPRACISIMYHCTCRLAWYIFGKNALLVVLSIRSLGRILGVRHSYKHTELRWMRRIRREKTSVLCFWQLQSVHESYKLPNYPKFRIKSESARGPCEYSLFRQLMQILRISLLWTTHLCPEELCLWDNYRLRKILPLQQKSSPFAWIEYIFKKAADLLEHFQQQCYLHLYKCLGIHLHEKSLAETEDEFWQCL